MYNGYVVTYQHLCQPSHHHEHGCMRVDNGYVVRYQHLCQPSHHHEHGCTRVDAGLGRHQSLSRNLVNPCPSRYNPLYYIAPVLHCATFPLYYNTLHSPVLKYTLFPSIALHCAKPPCTSLLCSSLCYIALHCQLITFPCIQLR